MGLFDSNTTTKPKIPGYAQNLYKDIFNQAENKFNKGKGGTAYTGSLVTPFDPTTMSAFSGMESLANANTGTGGMAPRLQEIMTNGGFSNDQMNTMQGMRDTIAAPWLNDMINGDGLTADQRAVADFYRTGMNEAWGTDAAYNQVRQNALDTSAQAVTGQAAKMGRFGGGANQNILARAQGDLAANMDTAELDKWRARRAAGAGGLAGISQQGVDNRSGATALKSGMQGQLFNAEASGLDRMGQAYQTALAPEQTKRAIGAEYEDLYSRQLADQKRIHDESDPLRRLQSYMSLANGSPQGTTSTTSPSWAQLLSAGGLAALSLPTLMGWGAPAAGGVPA